MFFVVPRTFGVRDGDCVWSVCVKGLGWGQYLFVFAAGLIYVPLSGMSGPKIHNGVA